jgi:predicted RNA-binding protein YlqC (UPF0109 family)
VPVQVIGDTRQSVQALQIIVEKVNAFLNLNSELRPPPPSIKSAVSKAPRRSPSPRTKYLQNEPDIGNMTLNIVVPEEMVSRLIGRNGENVKQMMNRTRTHISFVKKEDNDPVITPDGKSGRV